MGDAAEQQVATKLASLKSKYAFRVLHDVLIRKDTSSSPITAQLDHVVVDEMGVLVIETKVRTRAQLRGTYADANWTACYPSGKKAPLQNPLRQNEQHLNLLHQVLKGSVPELSLDSVRGCVVFVDTDVSRLELDSINKPRVQCVEDLDEWFADRYAFATRTPLTSEEQSSLGVRLINLDYSNDPETLRVHAAYRGGEKPVARSIGRLGATVTRSWTRPKRSPLPPPARTSNFTPSRGLPIKPLAIGGLVVVLLLALLWVGISIINHTLPSWIYGSFLVAALLLGGGGKATRSGRRGRSRSSRSAEPASFGRRLGAMGAMIVLFGLLALSAPWLLRLMAAQVATSAPTSISTPALSAPAVNVPAAQSALRDAKPDIYSSLVEPNSPKTAVDGPYVSYEWSYLDKATPASVAVRQIKITLDAAGRIVGVTGS